MLRNRPRVYAKELAGVMGCRFIGSLPAAAQGGKPPAIDSSLLPAGTLPELMSRSPAAFFYQDGSGRLPITAVVADGEVFRLSLGR
jgi:hypothetical protein